MSYFIKNAELFNTLIIINIIIQLGYIVKRRNIKCARHLAIIIKTITSKMNP